MTSIQAIEQTVQQLPAHDLAEFRSLGYRAIGVPVDQSVQWF